MSRAGSSSGPSGSCKLRIDKGASRCVFKIALVNSSDILVVLPPKRYTRTGSNDENLEVGSTVRVERYPERLSNSSKSARVLGFRITVALESLACSSATLSSERILQKHLSANVGEDVSAQSSLGSVVSTCFSRTLNCKDAVSDDSGKGDDEAWLGKWVGYLLGTARDLKMLSQMLVMIPC